MSEASGSCSLSQTMLPDPDYITYLLDPEQEYQCYFIVGNPALNISVERIGVVKKMLLAHSLVLRAELQDSKIAEKDDVKVTDLYPDTFKNMLRYTYGCDNTDVLTFDEMDNLLYAAEKYMLTKLKNKLATRLMSMLTYENICSLMNNPACYRVLELNSAITEIIQLETDRVLSSPHFLGLSPDAFVKILEQETLNAPEIDIWKAAVKWAKHRAKSEDGQGLRKELEKPLLHIRVGSLTCEEFCKEVAPANILTDREVKIICTSCGRREKAGDLRSICNEVQGRPMPLVKSALISFNLKLKGSLEINESTISLTTMGDGIELLNLSFSGFKISHQCNCIISLVKDKDTPIVVTFKQNVGATPLKIPMRLNGRNIQLFPNCEYTVNVLFACSGGHKAWKKEVQGIRNEDDFSLHLHKYNDLNVSHFYRIDYKTLKKG